jgi:heme-degrading monooxygenase HmoA
MNVVQVDEERREDFEGAFVGRESHVAKAPGFVSFELLRRERDGVGEYIVSSRWESEEAFKAWLESDSFKESHRHASGELAHGSEIRHYTVVDSKVPA